MGQTVSQINPGNCKGSVGSIQDYVMFLYMVVWRCWHRDINERKVPPVAQLALQNAFSILALGALPQSLRTRALPHAHVNQQEPNKMVTKHHRLSRDWHSKCVLRWRPIQMVRMTLRRT